MKNNSLKIAMIGHKRIPSREGGIEIVVEELSTRLVKLNHLVTAYNRKGHHISGKEHDVNISNLNGVKLKTVFTFQSSKLNAIVYSALAALRASLSKYDVVHFHAEGPAAMCFIPKIFGKKVIVTIHGLDWQRSKWGGFATRFLLFGEKMAAKYADNVIVLSKNVQKYFKDTYNRNTYFIPNGVSAVKAKSPDLITKKYNLKKDDYILFLGRIVPEKRVHSLINAYQQINTSKKLVIAGCSSHTDKYMQEVQELAKNNDNIIFTGFVDGQLMEELYSNAYIYCLPSDLEGMPLSLLEAMAYSNCCLTSSIDECKEVCENYAHYFEKSDENDLKNKLEYLLHNPNIVNEYKSSATDFILNKYNWDTVVDETLKLYR